MNKNLIEKENRILRTWRFILQLMPKIYCNEKLGI